MVTGQTAPSEYGPGQKNGPVQTSRCRCRQCHEMSWTRLEITVVLVMLKGWLEMIAAMLKWLWMCPAARVQANNWCTGERTGFLLWKVAWHWSALSGAWEWWSPCSATDHGYSVCYWGEQMLKRSYFLVRAVHCVAVLIHNGGTVWKHLCFSHHWLIMFW